MIHVNTVTSQRTLRHKDCKSHAVIGQFILQGQIGSKEESMGEGEALWSTVRTLQCSVVASSHWVMVMMSGERAEISEEQTECHKAVWDYPEWSEVVFKVTILEEGEQTIKVHCLDPLKFLFTILKCPWCWRVFACSANTCDPQVTGVFSA